MIWCIDGSIVPSEKTNFVNVVLPWENSMLEELNEVQVCND